MWMCAHSNIAKLVLVIEVASWHCVVECLCVGCLRHLLVLVIATLMMVSITRAELVVAISSLVLALASRLWEHVPLV